MIHNIYLLLTTVIIQGVLLETTAKDISKFGKNNFLIFLKISGVGDSTCKLFSLSK